MSQRPGPFNIGQALNDAVTLHRQGQLREAERIYARVLKAAPDHFDALNLLGTVKAQLNHFGEAHRLFAAAVKANPQVPQAWANLGLALHALKRDQEALDCFDKALALSPGDVAMINNRANALLSLNRAEEALEGFRDVLARAPQHGEARLNSGIALAALGRPDEALAEFDRAVTSMPGHPGVHFNRGLALYDVGRYAAAADAHDAALAAAPNHADAWLNRGRALAALNRYDEAIASYDKTLALRRDDANANFMASMSLLMRGDYAKGFEKYEWRWRRTGMPAQKSRGRLWLGEYAMAHKTILLHAEQGLGDTLQFVRYVPMLAASGANIMLEVQPELTTLLAQLKGPASIIARGDAPPQKFDVQCPLGTLPLAFKTELATVPADIPYLKADAAHLQKWSVRLAALPRPRVAIAWAGNPDQMNDRNRSTTFARLAPLLSLHAGEAGPSFISIQRQVRSDDAAALAAEQRVTHVGAKLDDFADTAAVVALCDLVITVDTSVAHLAGALGRPVWVMLTFAPDWRYTLGETTPWYPSARLFRQTAQGDWDGVVARVVEALRVTPPRP